MTGWGLVRTLLIDKIVATGSGFLYGTRFSGYPRYLAARRRGHGLAAALASCARGIAAAVAVAASASMLRLLALLPPGPGEKLFLCIMTIKKGGRNLP
jgi:hypothetical protein